MKNMRKLMFPVVLILGVIFLAGCALLEDDPEVTMVRVDETVLKEAYVAGDFSPDMIMLEVRFDDETGYHRPATSEMIAEEDREKLDEPGDHTVRLTYRDHTVEVDLFLVADETRLIIFNLHRLGVNDEAIEEGYQEWKDSIAGEDGREVEIDIVDNAIQWRYVDEETWQHLIGLEALMGEDAKDVEFAVVDEAVSWRYVDTETWHSLISLSDLEGPRGEQGVSVVDAYLEDGILFIELSDGEIIAAGDIETGDPAQEQPLREIIEQARASLIGVITYLETDDENENGGVALGSGAVFKEEDGTYYLFTNQHVIDGYTAIELVFEKNGNQFVIPDEDTTVIGEYSVSDIAVIAFESDFSFDIIGFADSNNLYPGEDVYAIGNPSGFHHYGSVTRGIVSKLNVYMTVDDTEAYFIQHDAAINPGNSGGPLINAEGAVIGMNTLKMVAADIDGMGYALPSNTMVRMIEDLMEDGTVTRGSLGVTTTHVLDCDALSGVCVGAVTADSTAEMLGLQENDLITGFKTAEMDTYIEVENIIQLIVLIHNTKAGEEISIRYLRDGTTVETVYEPLGVHPDYE